MSSCVLLVGLVGCAATSAPVRPTVAPAARTAAPVEVGTSEEEESYVTDELVGEYVHEGGGRWIIETGAIRIERPASSVHGDWRWLSADGDTHTVHMSLQLDGDIQLETRWQLEVLDRRTLVVRQLVIEMFAGEAEALSSYGPLATLRRTSDQ